MNFLSCITGLALLASLASSAQFNEQMMPRKKSGFSWDKVYTGGDIGGGFTGSSFLLNISPLIGYEITPRYSAGLGLTYIYYSDKSSTPTYRTSIYGASLFNRFNVLEFVFLHAEYQWLNGEFDYFRPGRTWINNIWVGGGIKQGMGSSYAFLMVLWNLNETYYSYPRSPWIRGGISIGL
ncbi:MAG: hypothetical protein AB1458_05920 [Bacteroidota bacterium]